MKAVRGLGGSLLWIVACLVGLVGALLSVTIVLAPVGVPLLFLARRLFKAAMTMFLPRGLRHPAQELGKRGRGALEEARKNGRGSLEDTGKKVRGKTKRRGLFGRKRSWFDRAVDTVVHALQ